MTEATNAVNNETSPAPPPAAVPWERHPKAGGYLDFWRTVWYVLRGRSRLSPDVQGPLTWKRAKNFRAMVIWHAMVGWGMYWLSTVYQYEQQRSCTSVMRDVGLEPSMPTVVFAGIAALLFVVLPAMYLVTGAAGWFFRGQGDDERRQRAFTMSWYATAPLALLGLAIPIGMLVIAGDTWGVVELIYGGTLGGIGFIAWWRSVVEGAYYAAGRSVKRALLAAVGMPIVVGGLWAMLMFFIPALMTWAAMILSETGPF